LVAHAPIDVAGAERSQQISAKGTGYKMMQFHGKTIIFLIVFNLIQSFIGIAFLRGVITQHQQLRVISNWIGCLLLKQLSSVFLTLADISETTSCDLQTRDLEAPLIILEICYSAFGVLPLILYGFKSPWLSKTSYQVLHSRTLAGTSIGPVNIAQRLPVWNSSSRGLQAVQMVTVSALHFARRSEHHLRKAEQQPTSHPQTSILDLGTSVVVSGQVVATLHQVLGAGAFGKVFRGTLRLSEAQEKDVQVAIKIANVLPALSGDAGSHPTQTMKLLDFCEEAHISLRLHIHPNIVCLQYICWDESRRSVDSDNLDEEYEPAAEDVEGVCAVDRLALFYDLVQGCNLSVFLTSRRPEWLCDEAVEVTRLLLALTTQLLHGLDYIHQHGVLHQDIKPDNILVQRTSPGTWTLKIADFGMASYDAEVSMHGPAQLHGTFKGGTAAYRSPEIAAWSSSSAAVRVPLVLTAHTSDLWAAALTVLQVYCGGWSPWHPFPRVVGGEEGHQGVQWYQTSLKDTIVTHRTCLDLASTLLSSQILDTSVVRVAGSLLTSQALASLQPRAAFSVLHGPDATSVLHLSRAAMAKLRRVDRVVWVF
jgi:serine/threonine protein kinase